MYESQVEFFNSIEMQQDIQTEKPQVDQGDRYRNIMSVQNKKTSNKFEQLKMTLDKYKHKIDENTNIDRFVQKLIEIGKVDRIYQIKATEILKRYQT